MLRHLLDTSKTHRLRQSVLLKQIFQKRLYQHHARTRGFQKASVGSNESWFPCDHYGQVFSWIWAATQSWVVLVQSNKNYPAEVTHTDFSFHLSLLGPCEVAIQLTIGRGSEEDDTDGSSCNTQKTQHCRAST